MSRIYSKRRMIKLMDHFAEHLTNLRQEINHLQGLNAQYRKKREHSPVEQSAFTQWQNRLQEIKQELSNLRDFPTRPAVWWDKSRRGI